MENTGNEIIIKSYSHGENDFWQLMGKYFASYQISKEMGNNIFSDSRYKWWLAIEKDVVVGFCAAIINNNGTAALCHGYVIPEYRNMGIYKSLFNKRLEYILSIDSIKIINATVTDISVKPFVKHGFRQIGIRGKYKKVRYEK